MGLTELLKRKRAGTKGKVVVGRRAKEDGYKKETPVVEETVVQEEVTPDLPKDETPRNETKEVAEVIQLGGGDVTDPFWRHACKELSETEAHSLMHNHASYHPWSPPIAKEIWPDVAVEASGDVCDLSIKANLRECGLLPPVQQRWLALHTERGQCLMQGGFIDEEQKFLFSLFSDYRNVFYNMKPYPTREEGFDKDVVLDAVVAHSVNHVLWSKQRLQNQITSRQLSRKKKRRKQETSPPPEQTPKAGERQKLREEGEEERILGFTFPKVLFLVPMRNSAFRIAHRILKLAAPADQTGLENVMEKLKASYGPDEALESALKREKKSERHKPPDHEALFHGHVADTVTIGFKFHLNGKLSVFRPLAESDIFIASPLSLSLLLEKKEREISDLLSSLEIVVLERTEVFLMQNWQHLTRVMHHLNQIPKETPPEVNLQHVRRSFLQNQGRCFRQTVMLSAFASAEMQALFSGPLCCNYSGRVRFHPLYPGVLHSSPHRRTIHRFERYPCHAVQESADARFAFFKSSTLEKLKTSGEHGILLFVPHFFDFLRVCDLLSSEGVSHGAISEYTGSLASQKLRRQFREREIRILVTTERAYFYNRPRFKAVQQALFYALPEHPHFYSEIVESIRPSPSRVTVLFCRFSSLQLERVVGTGKARAWLAHRGEVMTEAV